MRKWPGHVILSDSEESEVGQAARLVEPDASLPLSMTRRGHFFMACRKKDPLTCHAERQRSICGDGALGGVPGRRPAAPLPTTNQWRPCVVGRGAAGLRPGSRGPPNVFVMACHDKVAGTCHAERQRSIRGGPCLPVGGTRCFAALSMTCQRVFFTACMLLQTSPGVSC